MTPFARVLEVLGVIMAMLAWGALLTLVIVGVGTCSGCGGASLRKLELRRSRPSLSKAHTVSRWSTPRPSSQPAKTSHAWMRSRLPWLP